MFHVVSCKSFIAAFGNFLSNVNKAFEKVFNKYRQQQALLKVH